MKNESKWWCPYGGEIDSGIFRKHQTPRQYDGGVVEGFIPDEPFELRK
jgi:hypothetical protein